MAVQEAADRAAARRSALERFYAALSPEQQRVFDALGRLTGPGGSAPDDPQPGRRGPRPDHGPG
ncbi:Spy/CpxP family protein refolding chaperone [Phenylobacterium sp. SCN 70-31]|uniref:Spy/CpxP family protein refolding chaperone n=1 Tax=Phenylobacterium sp. SCN 70-31 TaxID=1660129 RepID=UPI000868BACB|nr:Spy/CpxP family protein refolding chaperone [Phenylobacterium sp. SCN 70-31]ODT86038.1 MAG: hypothetical protein ABS78_18110 [Phenylobacterium sp. SCN 70-31]